MSTTTSIEYQKFQERSKAIDDALGFLLETQQLDQDFGRQAATRSSRFNELGTALNSRCLKIVVVGEFSRGKSYLLNALMGMPILPTARDQTTCINTFVQRTDQDQPYVRVVFQEGHGEPLNLPWKPDVIRRWGTELDRENRDARKFVDRIEVYTDHPLFQNDVVLVDTPGFEGILPYHEDIARQAMDESHVAIWVQSAEQLGGTASEWRFLNETLRRNFNKFITVVNMWDLVIEPNDDSEKKKTLPQRVQEKRDKIKENFRKHADNLAEEHLDALTNSDHLLTVSAMWALSDDPRKQEQSNVAQLARRIEQLCISGEAKQEILGKPLKTLLDIQSRLKEELDNEVAGLESSRDLDDLRTQREKVDYEIQNLEKERALVESESRQEHGETARRKAAEVQDTLVAPLVELKQELELYVTEDYVRRQLEQKVKQLELPFAVKAQFQDVTAEVAR